MVRKVPFLTAGLSRAPARSSGRRAGAATPRPGSAVPAISTVHSPLSSQAWSSGSPRARPSPARPRRRACGRTRRRGRSRPASPSRRTDLGVEQQRLGVAAPAPAPAAACSGPARLLREHRVAADEAARLVERDREAEAGLEHRVGVVDVVAVVAVALLHPQAGQRLQPGVAQAERRARPRRAGRTRASACSAGMYSS